MEIDKQFLEKRANLSAAKQALLEKRLKQLQVQSGPVDDVAAQKSITSSSIPRRSRDQGDQSPLSFAQQRIWFLQNLEPESGFYNEPIALSIRGPLSIEALTKAAREIMRRHEVMASTFPIVEGQAVQKFHPALYETWELPVRDLSHIPAHEQADAVHRLAAEEMHRPFLLADEMSWRSILFKLNEEEHISLTVMHHIITDGWSMEIFIREIGMFYDAFSSGATLSLPEPALQYADYASWQPQWLAEKILDEQLPYWKERLSGSLPILELPTDRLRTHVQTYNGACLPLLIPKELTQRLQALGQQEGATLFMTLLTAFNVLLYRYSGQDDIIVGSPIAGRTYPELEDLIGCFVNTLALRTDMAHNPGFQALLKRVREVTLGAFHHQDLPFEKLVQELHLERDQSRNPLFQVMFTLQNMPTAIQQLGALTIAPYDVEISSAKFDISLCLQEVSQELKGYIEYNTDLFDRQTVERMRDHFYHILSAVAIDATTPIDEIELLSEAEWEQQLITWNQTQRHNPLDTCFPQLFEQQVHLTPDAPAVCDAQEQLTYAQLNARANQLAHRLVELGVGLDTLVALFAQRGVSLFTAILAVWKAGGAYLPLDLHAPSSRLATIVEQSGTTLVLTLPQNGNLDMEALAAQGEARGLRREIIVWDNLAAYSQENLPPRSTPAHLAYVLYTSGSTGVPKGVMIEQRGMLNHLFAKIHALDLHTQDRLAQTAALSFDISVWQMFAGLLVGAQVRIYAEEVTHDPVSLLEQADRDQISILQVVPSVLRVMLEAESNQAPTLSHLRWLVPTGEVLPVSLARDWFARYGQIPMLNAYGPTECSDDVAHFVLRASPSETLRSIPIGRPVDNTQLYVLDAARRPVPIGVPGELYVGGVGVGRGYLADEERTASAFVTHRFDEQEEPQRLYKTGDLVRYLADGNLEFLGRLDHQVKIRGFRIELGEIESTFNLHPSIQQSVVIAREDMSGNKYLVAYIVSEQEAELTANKLRSYAKEFLPDAMVPSTFVFLETLPLTPNGKLDRKALPDPDAVDSTAVGSYQAPRNATERQLAEIWCQLLNLPQVSIDENFFEIGGHSLLVAQVLTRIRDVFTIDLPLRTMFQFPTVELLAKSIERVQTRSEELRQRPSVRPVARESYRARQASRPQETHS